MCSYESGPKTHGLFDVREHLKLRSTEHSATFARVLHKCTAEATAEAFHVLLTQDWTIWLARCLWYVTPPHVWKFDAYSQTSIENTRMCRSTKATKQAQRRQSKPKTPKIISQERGIQKSKPKSL